ncbi:hypothetical protein FJZ19_02030 [Candidatus Pacearchaeota archaeon]|nr:hypothetical protein [Candidatus Pacearchaeota archaeon]
MKIFQNLERVEFKPVRSNEDIASLVKDDVVVLDTPVFRLVSVHDGVLPQRGQPDLISFAYRNPLDGNRIMILNTVLKNLAPTKEGYLTVVDIERAGCIDIRREEMTKTFIDYERKLIKAGRKSVA